MPELFTDEGNAFNTAKVSGVVLTSIDSGAPDTVVTMTTASLPAGTYQMYYSFQITFGLKNKTCYFKQGGTYSDAAFFAITAGDADELHKNRLYGFPKEHAGGPLTLSLEMYKIDTTAMTIDFADVVLVRVG